MPRSAAGIADPDNLFVTGGSGGGVLTAWIVGKTNRFRAAASQKPVINWTEHGPDHGLRRRSSPYWLGALPWENQVAYWARSPLSLMANVKTPTLVVVGGDDYRTPVSESEQYYTALKLEGVPTALVKVPGAGQGGSRLGPANRRPRRRDHRLVRLNIGNADRAKPPPVNETYCALGRPWLSEPSSPSRRVMMNLKLSDAARRHRACRHSRSPPRRLRRSIRRACPTRPDAWLRRVRGPRAGDAGEDEDGRITSSTSSTPRAFSPAATWSTGKRQWTQECPAAQVRHRRHPHARSSRPRQRPGRSLTQGEQIAVTAPLNGEKQVALDGVPVRLRRLRRDRARAPVGRFQGRRRQAASCIVLFVNDPDFEGG